MGYIIDENNIIHINSFKNIKIVDNLNIDKLFWNDGIIRVRDITKYKLYEVYILKINSNLFIKVKKPYNCAIFEKLFNFNLECKNFNKNRTILLSK